MGAVLGLFSLAIPVAFVALVVWALRRRGPAAPGAEARGVRRFFQYLVLLALVVVAAIGLSDLLARALGSTPGYDDRADLARSLAFVLVAVPLGALLGRWTARTHRVDAEERGSAMYALYVAGTALITLAVAMFALSDVLAIALGAARFDGGAVGRLVVFGAAWWFHWWLGRRTLNVEQAAPHLLLGSLIGLGTVLAGFVAAVAQALRLLAFDQAFLGGGDMLGRAAALFVTGALVWGWYWNRGAARLPRGVLWLVYVLPLGVGGGLLTALVGASIALWQLLVWFAGDRFGATAAEHFDSTPTAAAVAVGGLLVWWYHRTVLGRQPERTEVQRVHEYLVSGIGLLAAASGVGMVVVAAIEAFTPGLDLGMSVVNTLLGAVTLLLVGVPVWWVFWGRIRRATRAEPAPEVASPTRRTYLVLLFGLAGVAAVIALIVVVFMLLRDVLAGSVSGETIRSMRYGLGVLLATAAVSGYHGAVYRQDRGVATPARTEGPRSVLLVGGPGRDVEREVERRTGANVQVWARLDGAGVAWSVEDLVSRLLTHPGEDVLVLAGADGVTVVAVDRSGRLPAPPPASAAAPTPVDG